MAPQAPSKQTVTHTFCENRIPLPPKKKKKNSVPASKWVKVTLLLLQASSSLSPNHAMHTHKLDSAAQEETSVMVTFASSIWPHVTSQKFTKSNHMLKKNFKILFVVELNPSCPSPIFPKPIS